MPTLREIPEPATVGLCKKGEAEKLALLKINF